LLPGVYFFVFGITAPAEAPQVFRGRVLNI